MHPILANAGLPLFIIYSPVTFLTLPLIIWAELVYYRKVAPAGVSWKSVTIANCITTIVGAPLLAAMFSSVCFITNRLDWYEVGGMKRFIDRMFTDGFWALPGKSDGRAALAGIALYLIVAFLASVQIEKWYLRRSTTASEDHKVRMKHVLVSHAISYPVMIVTSITLLWGWSYAH